MLLCLLNRAILAFLVLFAMPLAVQAAMHWSHGGPVDWRSADRSSIGDLAAAAEHEPAVIRIYAARTVNWRGVFAVHSWIVVKDRGAARYDRYDKVGWGPPIRLNGYAPDGRWFGQEPMTVYAADGEEAERLIPKVRQAIAAYSFREAGDYRAWPGPNSNTFVASVMAGVPEIKAVLPPLAIGKDYPVDGSWIGLTPSGSGFRITLGGYLGLTLGWYEGIEVNLLGAVAGLDIRRPGIKLPGFGRMGL